MLDRLADGIREKLGVELTLPQVLEAGTWKAVRTRPFPQSVFENARARVWAKVMRTQLIKPFFLKYRAAKSPRSYDLQPEVLHSSTLLTEPSSE